MRLGRDSKARLWLISTSTSTLFPDQQKSTQAGQALLILKPTSPTRGAKRGISSELSYPQSRKSWALISNSGVIFDGFFWSQKQSSHFSLCYYRKANRLVILSLTCSHLLTVNKTWSSGARTPNREGGRTDSSPETCHEALTQCTCQPAPERMGSVLHPLVQKHCWQFPGPQSTHLPTKSLVCSNIFLNLPNGQLSKR